MTYARELMLFLRWLEQWLPTDNHQLVRFFLETMRCMGWVPVRSGEGFFWIHQRPGEPGKET